MFIKFHSHAVTVDVMSHMHRRWCISVQEVHYNQHGLLLLQGKGIYRLANQWSVLVSFCTTFSVVLPDFVICS